MSKIKMPILHLIKFYFFKYLVNFAAQNLKNIFLTFNYLKKLIK